LRRHHQARLLPHAEAFIRHSLTGGWLRPAHDPRAAQALGRAHDADLHARPEQRGQGSAQPTGKINET
jgi:hypothetical protein